MTSHLPQLQRHVTEAAARRARPRWRRIPLGRPVALGLIAAVAIGGGASALMLTRGSADPEIVAKLAILRRDRVPSDDSSTVGQAVHALQQRMVDASRASANPDVGPLLVVNLAETRRIRTQVPGMSIWVAPSFDNGSACLLGQSGTVSIQRPCMTRDQLDVGSGAVTLAFQDHVDLFGIVPDGISKVTVALRNGTEQSVRVLDNVYAARFTSATGTVSYDSPSGPVTKLAASGGD